MAKDKLNQVQEELEVDLEQESEGLEDTYKSEGLEDTSKGESEKGSSNDTFDFDKFLKENKQAQSAFDKRVDKALNTAFTKWEAQRNETEEERLNRELSEREQAITQKEAELAFKLHLGNVKEALVEEGLPSEFAELVANGTDEDTFEDVIAGIKKEWDVQMAELVKANARQTTPQARSSNFTTNTKSSSKADVEFARKNRKI